VTGVGQKEKRWRGQGRCRGERWILWPLGLRNHLTMDGFAQQHISYTCPTGKQMLSIVQSLLPVPSLLLRLSGHRLKRCLCTEFPLYQYLPTSFCACVLGKNNYPINSTAF